MQKIVCDINGVRARNIIYKMIVDKKHSYIGKTKREGVIRWNEHCRNIRNGNGNRNFKKHICSDSTIEFSIIRKCKKQELDKWEKFYINEYKPDLNVKKK